MSAPKAIVIPALTKHTATVICAHGLGDSGAGWVFLAENWRRKNKFPEVQFIFPSAPNIPITINMGMRMPGWYDIVRQRDFSDTSLSALQQQEDEAGILRSQAYFHSLVADQVDKGIPSNRIVLGGFSQGGALSLLSGLTCPQKLGGIFALSSYLLLQGKLKEMIAEKGNVNKDTPIFMGHGDADPMVRYEWGKATCEKLKEWGYNVDFRTYADLTHSADPEEIDHLEAFINQTLPPIESAKGGS